MSRIVDAMLRRVLDSYVSPFVEDIGSLSTAVLSGKCTLKNVALRRDLLDHEDTPLVLVDGFIEELVLDLPLTNPKGKPVVAKAKGVRLLLGLRDVREHTNPFFVLKTIWFEISFPLHLRGTY